MQKLKQLLLSGMKAFEGRMARLYHYWIALNQPEYNISIHSEWMQNEPLEGWGDKE